MYTRRRATRSPTSEPNLRETDPRITERRNPRTQNIDLAEPAGIVDLMIAEDRTVPDAVASQRDRIAEAIATAEATFRAGGRLFYVGAGTSGRLGVLDASECPPTFGTPPEMVQGIIAGGAVPRWRLPTPTNKQNQKQKQKNKNKNQTKQLTKTKQKNPKGRTPH